MKKALSALMLTAAFTLLAAATANATFSSDFKAQLKKHVKRVYKVNYPSAYVASAASMKATCATLTVVVPAVGTLQVTASGSASFPPPANPSEGTNLELWLNGTGPSSLGSGTWFVNGTMTETFTLVNVFPVAPGTYTFRLMGQSIFGGAGSIDVQTRLMSAEFMSSTISPPPP